MENKQTVFTVIKNYETSYLNNIYFIQKNSWIIQRSDIKLVDKTIDIVITDDFIFKNNDTYYYKFGLPGEEKLIDNSTIYKNTNGNSIILSFNWNLKDWGEINGDANFFQYYVETNIPVTKPVNNRKAKVTIDYPYQYKNNVLFYTLPYSGTGKEFGNYLYKITTYDLSNKKLIATTNSNYKGDYEGGICDEVIYLFKSGIQINGKLFDRFFDTDGYINLIFSVDEKLELSNQINYTYRLADLVDKQIYKLEDYQTSFNYVDYYEQTKSNEIILLVKDNIKSYYYTTDSVQKQNKLY